MAIAVVYLVDYEVFSGVNAPWIAWIVDHKRVWIDTCTTEKKETRSWAWFTNRPSGTYVLLCRPSGARPLLAIYPGLTPGATLLTRQPTPASQQRACRGPRHRRCPL